MLKKHRCIEAENFRNLPEKAQDLWFEWLLSQKYSDINNDAISFVEVYGFNASECESPIEKIFYIALNMALFTDKDNDAVYEMMLHTYINPQYEIVRDNGKSYRVDFYIDNDWMKYGTYGLIVECDGHEFHEKTKEQVNRRNDRDLELKNIGYDILHLSGSQIYNNPMKYAYYVIDYFKKTVVIDDELKKEMERMMDGREKNVCENNN